MCLSVAALNPRSVTGKLDGRPQYSYDVGKGTHQALIQAQAKIIPTNLKVIEIYKFDVFVDTFIQKKANIMMVQGQNDVRVSFMFDLKD